MIAKVVLNNKEQNIDRIFDYAVPEALCKRVLIGMRVVVPFGRTNKGVEGIIVALCEESDYLNLKEIRGIIGNEPVCSERALKLCLWISKNYFCSLYQAIRLTTPPGMASGVGEKTMKTVGILRKLWYNI